MSKSDVAKMIFDFLSSKNRPYSLNDMFEKFGKELGKSSVQKTLEALVTNNKIVGKLFGKQKIYFIRQLMTDTNEELETLTQKLSQSDENLKVKQNRFRELETKLKSLTSIPSLEVVKKEQGELLDVIREKNEKLKRMCSKQENIPISDIKKINQNHESFLTAYCKRKRTCNDMIEAILEGYPKSKRHLIEEIGIEDDNAVGFLMNT